MDDSDLPLLENSLTASTLNEEDGVDREQYHDDLLASILDARDDDLGADLQPNDTATVNSSDRLSTQLIIQLSKELNISRRCAYCRQEGDISDLCVCAGCSGRAYHKACWPEVLNHRPDPEFEACKPPTEFKEYVWIKYLLFSDKSPEEQAHLHKNDIWSTWFGVPNQLSDWQANLYLFNRLESLIAQAEDSRYGEPATEQYPSLVSFFGDTGGGKSTLIKALVQNAASDAISQVPIPGNHIDRHKSTSGDVHLYCDPKTVNSKVPIFYADCEGLRGAGVSAATMAIEGDTDAAPQQRKPLGRHTLREEATSSGRTVPSHLRHAVKETIKDHRGSAKATFPLQWANATVVSSSTGLTEKLVLSAQSRRLIVKELYPRLLYTFSDVVCYVTNNPRATEDELMHLFQWAASGHDRTVNQRVKPGLLIVINKDTQTTDGQWLDVQYATKTLLAHLELSTAFADLRQVWKLRGKTLNTAEDLILCYYDSFRIICIPNLSSTTTHSIAMQYGKLYEEVRAASERLRKKKIRVGMNLNVSSFGQYLAHAIKRLTRDITCSIDFHYMAETDKPRPSEFREHMTALFTLLVKLRAKESCAKSLTNVVNEQTIVDSLTPFVACCVASELRKNRSKTEQKKLLQKYLRDCRHSLERFRDTSWRCEAMNRSLRCRNYFIGHEKGHQFNHFDYFGLSEKRNSKPSILAGEFQCSFKPDDVLLALYPEITRLLDEEVDLRNAFPLVAKASGVASLTSNRTCFLCLSRCPVYILPCQTLHHTICEQCAHKFSHDYGQGQSSILLKDCPLGCKFQTGKPWLIRVKPPLAGVRVLSLDGGGVRGILELCLLRKVEAEVGYGIPIQELFDLVIGTSTGGIVALGLFKMNWSIEDAIWEFENLSSQAFDKRQWLKIPGFRHTAQILYSHRFKSIGIEGALQTAFGQGRLFGFNPDFSSDIVKVGVVAGVPGGRRPYLFTNYSRDSTGTETDYLVRQEDPNDDVMTWEAARCTSAAPTYFARYYHKGTHQDYIDGGLLRNNPIQLLEEERRLVWKDNTPPDILLSIGTGVQVDMEGTTKSAGKSTKFAQRFIPKGLRGKIAVGVDMIQSTLDCDRQWNDFLSFTKWDKDIKSVCHRLNIGLQQRPPNIDAVNCIPWMKQQAEWYLRQGDRSYLDKQYSSAHNHVAVIARRLIAALFYYEPIAASQPGTAKCWLHCRLSSAMREQFRRLLSDSPRFRVLQLLPRGDYKASMLTTDFDKLSFSSAVQFEQISEQIILQIQMPKWSSWEPISGFAAFRSARIAS